MKRTLTLAALAAALGLAQVASAAFIIETRTGGKGFANFALGPNMGGVVSNSTATSQALGITPALGSVFGGGSPSGTTTPTPDEYLFNYTPGTDADNATLTPGAALNDDGDIVSGMAGGLTGEYRVYATWPQTTNISNNPTRFVLTGGASTLFDLTVSQNEDTDATPDVQPNPAVDLVNAPRGLDGNLRGNEWQLLGHVTLTSGTLYTLSQTNVQQVIDDGFGTITYNNGFVSMRASGVLFQAVPEPSAALLALVGVAAGLRRRG